jgi:hypothetical protein
LSNSGFTQGITNNWIIGYGPNIAQRNLLDFTSGTLSVGPYLYPMQYRYTNTTISDINGNLLFSTNGYYIADATGDTMLNGGGLNPSFYTTMFPDGLSIPQANLAIPKPGSDSIYYLFHSTLDIITTSASQFLYLTSIDMSANGGLGGVIVKNQALISSVINQGKISACKHANGRDWWVYCHDANTSEFYSFLVTRDTILGPNTQSIGINRPVDAGQVVFSPDGTKFAYYWPIEDLEIFDFDRCTGMLSNPIHIPINDSASAGGVAFSPNSKVLYVSSTKYVYQYDLTSANIPASKQTVAVWDGFYSPFPPLGTYFVISQLAPDGKIYISTGNGGNHIHVINQPDSLGAACDLVQHGIQVPFYYFNTLPNHPNYFLGSDTTSVCDSLNWTGIYDQPIVTLNAFPNPSEGSFSISYTPNSETGILEIYDISGKKVHQESIAPWSQYRSMNIEYLPDGLYFLNMRWKEASVSVKIVIRS